MASAKRLTEAAVQRFPSAPAGERVDKPDSLAPGLFLRINDKGRKSWMVHFRVNGKQGKFALGTWPTMKIDEARERARWAREQAKAGVHPRIAHQALETERRRASGEIFDIVAEQYITAAKTGKLLGARNRPVTEETAKGRESRIRRLILPSFRNRALNEISAIEISEFLSRIEAKSGPVDRCLQDIRLIYKFAASRGTFHGLPPTSGLGNRQAPTKKSRALNDDELRAMWEAATEYGYPFGHAVKLLTLTGQRRDEIGEVKWSEIDFERRILTVPESRNKNRKGLHEVPLSDQALEILSDVRATVDALRLKSDFVFTSTGETPISGWSKASGRLDRHMRALLAGLSPDERKALAFKGPLRAENKTRKKAAQKKLENVKLDPWRFHDLRHTLITRMRDGEENEDGETTFAIPLDVVQQVVNHQITAGVTGVYDHGDMERRYRRRKKEALDWWGRKLIDIVLGGSRFDNVVAMARRLNS